MSGTVITDLFGPIPDRKPLEVHEHHIISGPRAHSGKTIVHSHERGELPHGHEHTGPAAYTIDKDDWARATGLQGGGRKRFTDAPEGEQLPIVELEDWQKSFTIVVGDPPPGFSGTGGGYYAAARMILACRMTVDNVVPFGGPKKKVAG